jgi:hypothetical protein
MQRQKETTLFDSQKHTVAYLRVLVSILTSVSLFSLPGCLWLHSFAEPPQDVHLTGIETALPCETSRGAIVKAFINNKGPFRCLVDSGTRGCVLSLNVARQISLWQGFAEKDKDLKKGSLIEIDSWKVGNEVFGKFYAVIEDPGDVDCIMGANVMTGLSFGWDPGRKAVIINAGIDSERQKPVSLPIHISGGRPFIEISINGKKTNAALLAPGFPQSQLSVDFAGDIGLSETNVNSKQAQIIVDIQGLGKRNGDVPIVTETSTGIFHRKPDLRIASDILSFMYTIIDFKNERVYFYDNLNLFPETNKYETGTDIKTNKNTDVNDRTMDNNNNSKLPNASQNKDINSPLFGR